MSEEVREISLRIVAVQATIDERHYAVVYIGDDIYRKNHFRVYLNGKAVSLIVWDPKNSRFSTPKWTNYARSKGYSDGFVWPNEVKKKMFRKLTDKSLYRMVKIT